MMRFLRQNQYLLCFLAVTIFSCVMVLREVIANQSAHVERREDFLLLQERGQTRLCEHLYQRLIQELPEMSDRSLGDDYERLAMVVDPKKEQNQNLAWKYCLSVKKELEKRADRRISKLVHETAGQ